MTAGRLLKVLPTDKQSSHDEHIIARCRAAFAASRRERCHYAPTLVAS